MEVSIQLLVVSLLVGIFVPPLVELLKALFIPKGKRRLTVFLLSLFSSLAVGLLVALATEHKLDLAGVIYTIAAAEITYGLVWKAFGLDEKMNKAITSGKK